MYILCTETMLDPLKDTKSIQYCLTSTSVLQVKVSYHTQATLQWTKLQTLFECYHFFPLMPLSDPGPNPGTTTIIFVKLDQRLLSGFWSSFVCLPSPFNDWQVDWHAQLWWSEVPSLDSVSHGNPLLQILLGKRCPTHPTLIFFLFFNSQQQYYISFRYTLERLDMYMAYKVSDPVSLVPAW